MAGKNRATGKHRGSDPGIANIKALGISPEVLKELDAIAAKSKRQTQKDWTPEEEAIAKRYMDCSYDALIAIMKKAFPGRRQYTRGSVRWIRRKLEGRK